MSSKPIEVSSVEKSSGNRRLLPLSARIGLTIIGVAASFVVGFYLQALLSFPGILVKVGFFSVLMFGLIFPHLRYRKDNWAVLPAAVLALWIIVLTAVGLPLAKQIRLSTAEKEIPKYPTAELVSTSYVFENWPSTPQVEYVYRVDNTAEEFPKIKEFYMNELSEDEWGRVAPAWPAEVSNEPLSDISYYSRATGSPRVHIFYEEKEEDPIRVRITF